MAETRTDVPSLEELDAIDGSFLERIFRFCGIERADVKSMTLEPPGILRIEHLLRDAHGEHYGVSKAELASGEIVRRVIWSL